MHYQKVDTILKLSKNVRPLLIELFKTMLEMGEALINVSEGVLMGINNNWKEYKFGTFKTLISITNLSVSTFVSFYEEYIKGMEYGFDFICELLQILGVENFGDVFRRKVDLGSIVKPAGIDINLLKFQLKTVLEYSFPKLEELGILIYRKAKKLPNSAKFIESKVINDFKISIENLSSHWINFLKKLHSTTELIFKEKDTTKCVNLLIQIIERGIDHAIRVWRTTKLTPLFTRDWIDYNIYEITKSAEKFSEIKRELEILTKCREKTFEHGKNSYLIILKTLWDSEEKMREKLEKIIRMFIPEEDRAEGVEELVPQKFSIEDLSFALALARSEFDLSKRAENRLRKNIESLRLAGEWLKSSIIYRLYETTIKRLEVKEKYDRKVLELLIELQELTKAN
ncbi:MAG: hypothetical protein ACETWM_20850 [Candidatus Lokiarchaeia archaeon]